ncbi:hypothetical protein KM043_010203 [Ampulex compressa]|nr:hypothetical protein KM043_010203 [Ampulex compressa]
MEEIQEERGMIAQLFSPRSYRLEERRDVRLFDTSSRNHRLRVSIMPKSGHVTIDESALINLVKPNPELYDPAHCKAVNEQHIDFLWEDIAEKLDVPVESVKKSWKNLMRNYKKTSKASKRTSLRSTTNLNFLPVPL